MRVRSGLGLVFLLFLRSASLAQDVELPTKLGESLDVENLVDEELAEPLNCRICDKTAGQTCACIDRSCWGVERLWFRGDYLMWWTEGNRVPALVTGSPAGTVRGDAGVLGLTNTRTFLGDERLDNEVRDGGRVVAGFWLDERQRNSLEASWFTLDDGDSTSYSAASQAWDPILARPFFNTGIASQDAQLVGFPNVVDGQIDVMTTSDVVSGSVAMRRLYRRGTSGRLDFLLGYRYLRFDEKLTISEQLVSTNPGGVVPLGTIYDVSDRFETNNDFHGADIGAAFRFWRNSWTLDVLAKTAIGGVQQQLDISGNQRVRVPGLPPASSNNGLLAAPSNIGSHEDTNFAVVPEVNVNLHYDVCRDITFSVGYTMIALSSVLRTGDQIDVALDGTNLPTASDAAGPGTGNPVAAMHDESFWVQGISLGLEIRR